MISIARILGFTICILRTYVSFQLNVCKWTIVQTETLFDNIVGERP